MGRKMENRKIVIGTRGSKLALWQAGHIQSELQRRHPGITIEINKSRLPAIRSSMYPLHR